MIAFRRFSTILLLVLAYTSIQAQSGISVSPPRNYFTVAAGQSESKKILVSNPSKTTRLDLAVSLNDWNYDSYGSNLIHDAGTLPNSCANWISILPQSYFSLAPGETHEMELIVSPPPTISDPIPVHTAMLYITQINPEDAVNEHGANIKVSVRTGIKIYQRYPGARLPQLEIDNFSYSDTKDLLLEFTNNGNIWADGTLNCELINQETGAKTQLSDAVFYTIPNDSRKIIIALPDDLAPGKYIATAILNYGDDATIKMAELSFSHE
ncbi:molecular chaperone [Flavobacterium sp. NKUCC04_CG]|uniref:fimbrial biogenesis chaperone n=1 Tax=Flavobacterium sp. NKUCC04_CG TaxID=2842121 RepID=UPI001C5AD4B1|nr:molecular chaperone [Flavobacterium sp. NKUCC04_CG]MBW3517585.1 molecular chaperone [Flavobacterium sp. NKUCC04_CG]